LSPWWLRPTAEGAEDLEDKPQQKEQAAKPDGGSRPEGRKPDRSRPERSKPERTDAERSKPDRGRSERPDRPRRERDKERAEAKDSGRSEPRGSGRSRGGSRSRDAAKPDAAKPEAKRPEARRAEPKKADEPKRAEPRKAEPKAPPEPKGGNGTETTEGNKFRRDQFTFDDVSFHEIAEIREEILSAAAERNTSVSDERKIAMFCDLENIALGVRDSAIKKFDIDLVMERLLEKGKVIVKKAYCDWERYSEYKRPMHEAAIELIDIPQKYYSGKNSADIKMVVDAMDLSYSKEHLDTFVIMSGDSDFSPLVSKLKENNKYVIGIGVKDSSSNLLIDNCDEFIMYEDLYRDRETVPKVDGKDAKKNEAFRLMVDAIQALLRDNKDVLWGSMIKQTMQRKKPSFNEGYYGYSTFSELLEDAERNNLVKLKKDQRSGTYIVTGFAKR